MNVQRPLGRRSFPARLKLIQPLDLGAEPLQVLFVGEGCLVQVVLHGWQPDFAGKHLGAQGVQYVGEVVERYEAAQFTTECPTRADR